MFVIPGVLEVGQVGATDQGGSPIGIVVVAGLDCPARICHFPDGTEMVSCVVVWHLVNFVWKVWRSGSSGFRPYTLATKDGQQNTG